MPNGDQSAEFTPEFKETKLTKTLGVLGGVLMAGGGATLTFVGAEHIVENIPNMNFDEISLGAICLAPGLLFTSIGFRVLKTVLTGDYSNAK